MSQKIPESIIRHILIEEGKLFRQWWDERSNEGSVLGDLARLDSWKKVWHALRTMKLDNPLVQRSNSIRAYIDLLNTYGHPNTDPYDVFVPISTGIAVAREEKWGEVLSPSLHRAIGVSISSQDSAIPPESHVKTIRLKALHEWIQSLAGRRGAKPIQPESLLLPEEIVNLMNYDVRKDPKITSLTRGYVAAIIYCLSNRDKFANTSSIINTLWRGGINSHRYKQVQQVEKEFLVDKTRDPEAYLANSAKHVRNVKKNNLAL